MKMKFGNFKVNGTKLEFSLCHQKPERSFFWKGKQFPSGVATMSLTSIIGIYIGNQILKLILN